MEQGKYQVQGRELHQGEMTLGQTKRVLKFVAAYSDNPDFKKIKDVKSAIQWLLENDLIDQALDLILTGDKQGIVWDDLSNSVLVEIGTDFLALNREWIKKLKDSLVKSKN